MGRIESAETVDGLLDTLRGMDAPDAIPPEVISAYGIGRLLDMSSAQVGNWMQMGGETGMTLPFSNQRYYGWGHIGLLVPPSRIAEASRLSAIRLDRLPGSPLAHDDDGLAYARLLQVLLSGDGERPYIPLDWNDPVSERVAGWLGGAACTHLERKLGRRRPLVIGAQVVAPVVAERPEPEEPPADATAGAAPEAVAQLPDRTSMIRAGSMVPVEQEVVPQATDAGSTPVVSQAEGGRRAASVTKIFDRTLRHGDLYRLGADRKAVDEAVARVWRGHAGASPGPEDEPVYHGSDLQNILISLFGLRASDAEEHLGVREDLIARYVGREPEGGHTVIRRPETWMSVLQEFRPDLVDYQPLPDMPPEVYGFEDVDRLLKFLQRHGGDLEMEDGEVLLSYPAQQLLSMQLVRDSLPRATDDEYDGWQNTEEMADAHYRTPQEVLRWSQELPRIVGYLGSGRMTWLRSRQEPHIALPHYSPAVGKLFEHIANRWMEDELMDDRRRRLYYPSPLRAQILRHEDE